MPLKVATNPEVERRLAEALERRSEAEQALSEARRDLAEAILYATQQGYSLRRAAGLLGISGQRAHELVAQAGLIKRS